MMIYVLAGRLGASLIQSKLSPLTRVPGVEKLVIFCERQDFSLNKCEVRRLHLPFRQPSHPVNSFLRIIGTFFGLLFEILRRKPALIYALHPLPMGWIGFVVARLTGTKIMIQMIGGEDQLGSHHRGKWFWRRANLWVLRRCDWVGTKGKNLSEVLVGEGVCPDQIFEFKGSVGKIRPVKNPGLRDIDVLFIGRFIDYKGPQRFVEVVCRLASEFPAIHAEMLGEGELKTQMEKMVVEKHLENHICLRGQVDNVGDYCWKAKVFLQPSEVEGLSTALMEAMAGGCVPVISDVGDQKTAVAPGINAFVVGQFDDIAGYTECVRELIYDDKKRIEMSERASCYAAQNFSEQAEINRWQNLLARLHNK